MLEPKESRRPYLFDTECSAKECPNPILNPCGCNAMAQALREHQVTTSDNIMFWLPAFAGIVFDHKLSYCPWCGTKV